MVFVIFGSTSAIIVGVYLDKTHEYLFALRLTTLVSTISVGFVYFLLPTENFFLSMFSVLLAGIGLVPIMAIAYSFATECTHPV